MTIDVYSATGTKKGTATLPKSLFEAPVNEGLMHQMLVLQQANRRTPVAHTKGRGEMSGSTRKLFAQKGTGRARRGPVRSPIVRGGGKAFGPLKVRNFTKDMPRQMRRAALRSCLSLQASNGVIIGLEGFGEEPKTKTAHDLLTKLPVDLGRRILLVVPGQMLGLHLSVRNIPGVEVCLASYLNPEQVLRARHLVFVGDALAKAEEVFGKVSKVSNVDKVAKETSKTSKTSPTSKTSKKKRSPSTKA